MEKPGKRVHLNLKVLPEIKAGVERIARRERRSESNVAEILLEWALHEVDRAGSTLTLIGSRAHTRLRNAITEDMSNGSTLPAPNDGIPGRQTGTSGGNARASKLAVTRRKHTTFNAKRGK